MHIAFLVAAVAVGAIAVPVADPEPATTTVRLPSKYVTSTVYVTVNPAQLTRTSSTTKRTSTSTRKTSTSSRKSTTARTTSTTARSTSTTARTTSVRPTTSSTAVGSPITASRTSTTSAGTRPTTFSQIAVFHHNLHRANHSAPNMVWDTRLASIAADIASTCVYQHDTAASGGGYGQNIAAGVKADNISAVITELFYNGEQPFFDGLYGQANPSFANFARWGHFSQIVWKASTRVGCAVQFCPNGLANTGSNVPPYFTVCNYEEPGNFGGEYADNIGRPLGRPIAHWNTGLSGA